MIQWSVSKEILDFAHVINQIFSNIPVTVIQVSCHSISNQTPPKHLDRFLRNFLSTFGRIFQIPIRMAKKRLPSLRYKILMSKCLK